MGSNYIVYVHVHVLWQCRSVWMMARGMMHMRTPSIVLYVCIIWT